MKIEVNGQEVDVPGCFFQKPGIIGGVECIKIRGSLPCEIAQECMFRSVEARGQTGPESAPGQPKTE